MRITSGKFRNRKLTSLKGDHTRPSSEKLREGIFSSMACYLTEDSRILDLCAGTGAIGIEAISRGCKELVCVENNRYALDVLKKNVLALDITNVVEICRQEVLKVIPTIASKEKKFDLIYCDPPYEKLIKTKNDSKYLSQRILESIDLHANDLLAENGWMLLEETSKVKIEHSTLKNLKFVKEKKYGLAAVLFFRKN